MKQIFVGSSSRPEAERYARAVFDEIALISPDTIKPVYWRDSFPLGLVTFDALERMLRTCSGAALVATPEIEGQPNENVMLEFGLVAGRMGITNVALCKHAEAKVPSDLLSLTYAEIKPATPDGEVKLSDSAVNAIRQWVLALPETMEGLPCTRVVHGYTGRCRVFLKFDRWRQIPITGRSIATLEGTIDLFIPPDGKNGYGLANGEILLSLREPNFSKIPFKAQYKVCAGISDVECLPCGELTFKSHTISRQRTSASGEPWTEEGLDDQEVGPWNFDWRMFPDATTKAFRVKFTTDLIDWTSATGELRPATEV